MKQKDNFYILTGGPGVGKTTLVEELKMRGYNCVPEVARKIIKDQVNVNGNALPWGDAKKYSGLMLSYSVSDFERLIDIDDILFFDRGIPDTYGYEQLMKFDYNANLQKAVTEFRYNKTVFVLPPWKEIYETDSERKQNFSVAVETYQIMCDAYLDLGYDLIEVPCMSVKKRADFVLERVLQ